MSVPSFSWRLEEWWVAIYVWLMAFIAALMVGIQLWLLWCYLPDPLREFLKSWELHL